MRRFLMYGISKSLLIKIIIALLILLGVKDVFAQDFDVTTKVTAPTCSGSSCSGGHYTGLEIYNTGSQNVYAVKTRYNGKLSTVRFNIPISGLTGWPDGNCFSTGDVSYRLTLLMDTNDWNNNFARPFISNGSSGTNWATGNVVFVSYKKIYIDFKIPTSNTCEDFIYVYLRSPNESTSAITQISNWQLQNITLSATWPSSGGSSGGSGGSGSGGTSTDSSNTDIINNNNENTTDIINNNNENTQEIINNQNENTYNNCSIKDYTFQSRYLGYICNANGGLCNNNNYFASDYVRVKYGYTYTINFKDISGLEYGWFCWYNNDELISCSQYRNTTGYGSTMQVTPPADSNKLSITYKKDSGAFIHGYICTNPDSDISNAITSEEAPDIDLDIDIDTNSPVSDLLTMPLTILNKVFDITDDSCQPYVLPFDFFGGNNTLTLPCINLQDRLGNNVYNILDTLLCFFIAYNIGLMCISIYENITSLNDSFQSLYSPKHGVGGRTEKGEMEGRYD